MIRSVTIPYITEYLGKFDLKLSPVGSDSRPLKEALCLGGRESLRGHRVLDTPASRGDESKQRRGLLIRHFRYDHKILLTKREIQMDQLAASLLAKAGNRRFAIFGFRQPTFDVVSRETALCDEDRHTNLPSEDCCLRVALYRILKAR